jgi:hypothetical protein
MLSTPPFPEFSSHISIDETDFCFALTLNVISLEWKHTTSSLKKMFKICSSQNDVDSILGGIGQLLLDFLDYRATFNAERG